MLPAMPSWALALALASLLASLNAHFPILRRPGLAVLSFFAGWFASELPLWWLAWQVALVAAPRGPFAQLGASASGSDLAVLGLFGLAWVGLAGCHLRARAARRALEPAIGAPLRLSPGEALRALVPIVPRSGVERVRDLVYVEADGYRLRLDLRRPRATGAAQRLPVLIQIHGGAWIVGRKEQQGLPLVHHMAARGWACLSIDYRLCPRATFPDALVDVKRAIAWVRENAERWGLDAERIVLTGGSAGGHLASLAALTAGDPRYQPGFERVDTRVRACVPFYGVYDFTNRFGQWPNRGLATVLERWVIKRPQREAPEAWEEASPVGRVHGAAPDFFVLHGDKDSLVPVDDARRFVEALRGVSRARTLYAELPGAQHAFDVFLSLRTAYAIRAVERFLSGIQGSGAPASR